MASGDQRPRSWLGSRDSLQPEAPPERRRVAGQASALSPQQPPRERAGTIAIEAGGISGRGQGSRLQASEHGPQACSARSPGAAPPLTMLARRGIHSGRRPAVDRGRVGRSSIRRPRRFCQCDYYCFFSPEPSGKPAGPNSHTRRTASFHPRSGTRPLRGRMACLELATRDKNQKKYPPSK